MFLPTKNNIQTLDHNYFGQPFCYLTVYPDVNVRPFDYNYLGQPFWALPYMADIPQELVYIVPADDLTYIVPKPR